MTVYSNHIFRKVPYKLSQSRKRGIRERLRNVESVLNLLNSTGIKLNSLVLISFNLLQSFELIIYF